MLKNIDKIFDYETFAASPSSTYRMFDCGLILLKPSKDLYRRLSDKLVSQPRANDFVLLNSEVHDWMKIPSAYNTNAWMVSGDKENQLSEIKVINFKDCMNLVDNQEAEFHKKFKSFSDITSLYAFFRGTLGNSFASQLDGSNNSTSSGEIEELDDLDITGGLFNDTMVNEVEFFIPTNAQDIMPEFQSNLDGPYQNMSLSDGEHVSRRSSTCI